MLCMICGTDSSTWRTGIRAMICIVEIQLGPTEVNNYQRQQRIQIERHNGNDPSRPWQVIDAIARDELDDGLTPKRCEKAGETDFEQRVTWDGKGQDILQATCPF